MRAVKKFDSRGFTLIELMIVVAIVACSRPCHLRRPQIPLTSKRLRPKSVGQMAKDAAAYERETMAPRSARRDGGVQQPLQWRGSVPAKAAIKA
jgi:prepilin-type N-terminal cleavage/methylation domain-containing protein